MFYMDYSPIQINDDDDDECSGRQNRDQKVPLWPLRLSYLDPCKFVRTHAFVPMVRLRSCAIAIQCVYVIAAAFRRGGVGLLFSPSLVCLFVCLLAR